LGFLQIKYFFGTKNRVDRVTGTTAIFILGPSQSLLYPTDSNTCIEVTTHMESSCFGFLPNSLKITVQVFMEASGTQFNGKRSVV
jgi:hypothetical protein